MKSHFLTLLVIGFAILLVVQALLGGWLVYLNIGFTPSAIQMYYADKTLHGLLEVILPHILFMTVALVALTHFLTFIPILSEKKKSIITHFLFSFFVLDQLSPFGIASGVSFFVYIKLLSFLFYELGLALVLFILFQSVLYPLEENKDKYPSSCI